LQQRPQFEDEPVVVGCANPQYDFCIGVFVFDHKALGFKEGFEKFIASIQETSFEMIAGGTRDEVNQPLLNITAALWVLVLEANPRAN